MPFHRKVFDVQPAHTCAVLLASDGRQDFSPASVALAADLAGGERVGVVTIAKIYGSSLGLPHPGLLPTRPGLDERRRWVNAAIRAIEGAGGSADGQVAATRRAGKKLAAVARTRRPRVVVIDETPVRKGVRRLVEGDVGA